ncbi:hypothetical protein ACFY4C_31595 [Actinomadura viridis]|uniref:hypothetical protein n=1 Tax=Actinomadura viridis TaxID=58110 RepID=UPI0036846AFB
MACELMKAAGVAHASVDNITRQMLDWEKGLHFPRDWTDAYAIAFDTTPAELFGDAPPMWASSLHEPLAEIEDDVKRRALLGILATAAATVPLGYEGERQRAALNSAFGTAPTDRDADTWERVAYDYAHEVGTIRTPAPVVLPELLTDLGELSALIPQATGLARHRLFHSAAELAALTAIAFTQVGDFRSARRWWRSASRAADESGDHLLSVRVRGKQAVISLYEGGSPELSSLDTAEEAIAIGRGVPCGGTASAYAAKAQALAQLGRHAEAVSAVETLRKVFDKLPDGTRDDTASQWGWYEQRLHFVVSHVETLSGDVTRANAAQETVVALHPGKISLGRAQIELHRAGCMLRTGDVDEGARHTVRILERLPAGFASDGLLRRTASMSLRLAPPDATNHPSVREAREVLALTSGER